MLENVNKKIKYPRSCIGKNCKTVLNMPGEFSPYACNKCYKQTVKKLEIII